MQGEPWGKNQSAFYNSNPVLDFKKHSCTCYCPQKKHTHTQLKGEKKFHAPENCSTLPSKKIKVHPYMFMITQAWAVMYLMCLYSN